MIPTQRITQLLSEMVRIPSVTPMQTGPRAGTPGEARMAEYVETKFRSLGGEVHREDVFPNRPSVYGIWRVPQSNRWMGLDVHTDTVGVEQMTDEPFDGRIENRRVYGRGAVDTKASLAIAIALLEQFKESGKKPSVNLLVAATADEEGEAYGAPAFAKWLGQHGIVFDQLCVAEPTMCAPIHGHKGAVRCYFDVEGIACHSSKPELGKNAITAAARIVLAMEREHLRLKQEHPGSPVGHPTLTVTIINGGVGINVVPDKCTVAVDRRIVTGEVAAEVSAHLQEIARQACELPMKVRVLNVLDAFYRPSDSALVRTLAQLGGGKPEIVPYGTNAFSYASDVARDCVVIGPGSIDQAHGKVEWVEIAELEKMARMYAKLWGIT